MNELAFPELYSFSQLTAPAQDGSGPREDSGGDHEFLDEVPEPDTDVQQARKRARALESGQCRGWWRFFREGGPGGLLGGGGISAWAPWGRSSCPAKASGRNGPRGSSREGKGWQAEA